MKIDRNEFSEFFFSGKNFTHLIFSPDLSLWFHKTSKKVGSADIIFFFTDITFFFYNFQFCMENPPKKKNDITFLRLISLLKLKCKACFQHKTMLSLNVARSSTVCNCLFRSQAIRSISCGLGIRTCS